MPMKRSPKGFRVLVSELIAELEKVDGSYAVYFAPDNKDPQSIDDVHIKSWEGIIKLVTFDGV